MKLCRIAAVLAVLPICLCMAACGAGDASVPVSETVEDSIADTTSVSDSTRVDSITVEVEVPTKTVFTQTYDRYICTVLTDSTAAFDFAESGELLDLALAARDAAVEVVLDISIQNETVAPDKMADEVIRREQAGESVDLLRFSAATTAASLVSGGHLADLAQLGEFDLQNAALDHSLNSALTLANHCYFLFGAATLTDKLETSAILVDTAAPTLPEGAAERYMTQVLEGNWTTEAWLAAVAESSLSLNGDAALPLFVGAGGKLFEKDATDIPALFPNENFSRSYAVMQKAMAASNSASNAAFMIGNLRRILTEDTLLALPIPALEADMPYRSAVDPRAAECISVPVNQSDAVRTGDILTAYFEQSADTTAVWLYDQLLAAELAAGGDEELLALILAARESLLGTLFGWGDLGESLIESVGMAEEEYLDGIEMRMAVAERAMNIVLDRLTDE